MKNKSMTSSACISVTAAVRNILILVTALFVLNGCTHHHVPEADTYDFDAIPEFTSSNSVSLVNVQSSDEVLFATNMGHKWYGDLQQWTDTAIEITERELSLRGMKITDNAPRTLEMAITSASTTTGGWGFSSHVTLQVVTGDGYKRIIVGDGPSPMLNRAADAGIMRAVAAMLRDEKILQYLTEQEN